MMRVLGKWVRFVSLAMLLSAAAIGASQPTERQKEQIISSIGQKLERKAFAFEVDFSTWGELAAKNRETLLAADSDEAFEAALDELLDQYDLSHLGVSSPAKAKLRRQGQRSGMGITVHPNEEKEGFFVSFVIENSPAQKCGLQKGDWLTHIDETPLLEIQQLKGEIGQQRSLRWKRKNEKHEATLTYGAFPSSEKSRLYWIDGDIAVLRIQSFQYRYYQAAAINRYFKEIKRKARGLIIDLRNNRGGLSFYSRHLASKLSPCKETFALLANKDRKGRPKQREVHPLPFSRPYNGPVVVLVDSLSASAADIVPAFVSESGRGLVVGQRTSGALQLARTVSLPYGYRLYLPIAELLTPKGNRLENNGFTPEIVLDLEQTTDDETILPQAVRLIENQLEQNPTS